MGIRKMRQRRPIVAPVVERKRRRNPGAQAPSPSLPRALPDRQIRAWRPDDVEARELEAFNRQSDIAQKQAAIAEACKSLLARLYRANDLTVYEQLAQREVDCWAVSNSISHVVEIPRPSDGSPRHWRVYAKDAATKANNAPHHARLGQSLFSLWPNARRIVSDARAPKKPRWWDCIRDMRKKGD
jgi:hypothetical protein